MKIHSKSELLFFANITKLSQLPYKKLQGQSKDVNKFLKHHLGIGNCFSYKYINVLGTELVVLIEGTKAYVSFRGTDIHHTDIIPHAVRCSKNTQLGKVHKGYYAKFVSIASQLHDELTERGINQVYFVGHSLGGALAQLAYLYAKLRLSYLESHCITFGSCKPIRQLTGTYHSNVHNYYLKHDYVGLFPFGFNVINEPIILNNGKKYDKDTLPFWGLGKALSSIFITKRHSIDVYIREINKLKVGK